ncbi:MAG: amidohydrolase family protein, partial [Bacillota bacterium]
MTRLCAYTNATVIPIASPTLDRGTLLVRGQRIEAVGERVAIPAEAEIIDLSGRYIIPGIIDAHCHVGMAGDGEGPGSADASETTEPVNGRIRAMESVNPAHRSFEAARAGGVTAVHILPLGNPIAGLSFTCKTAGSVIDDMVVKNPTGLKAALGEGPKRAHGLKKGRAPMTRMGIAGLIRDYFARARRYAEGREDDPRLDAGARVIRREFPLRIHAHRSDDVITAVRLCEELEIPFSVEHCTGGHLVAGFLGERSVTAHVGPVLAARGPQERTEGDERTAAVLHAAGVRVCLVSDHPFVPTDHLLLAGALGYKHGMSLESALSALTLNPARSLGVDDRIGSLAPGGDADFVVLSGRPFSYRSAVVA